MKLISCHIENFGVLKDYDYRFKEGENIIVRDNGQGKSTFAAFIRIMLFGFSNEMKRSESENERQRYRPFQGGVYGGSLTFSDNESIYTITKNFGIKEAQDSFNLINERTGLPSSDFEKNPGEKLFLLDSESFMRTAFIGQNDIKTALTSKISAGFSDERFSEDMIMYDRAEKELNDRINKLSPVRKTGDLYKKRSEIETKETELRKKAGLPDEIKETKERIREKNAEITTIENEIAEITEEISVIANRAEEYRRKEAEKAEKAKEEAAKRAREEERILAKWEEENRRYETELIKKQRAREIYKNYRENEEKLKNEYLKEAEKIGNRIICNRDEVDMSGYRETEEELKLRAENKKAKKLQIVTLISTLLFAFVSVFVYVFVNTIVAFCCTAISVILLSAFIILTVKKSDTGKRLDNAVYWGRTDYRNEVLRLSDRVNGLKREYENAKREADNFLLQNSDMNEETAFPGEKPVFERAQVPLNIENRGGQADETGKLISELCIKRAAKEKLTGALNELEKYCDGLVLSLREAEETEHDIVLLENEYAELLHENDITLKTLDFLKKAKEEYMQKYRNPLTVAFKKYYEIFTGTIDNEISIDINGNPVYAPFGICHSVELLSSGSLNLLYFCYRLSCLDVFYKNEKPFIILDDPFSEFDDERVKKARELVKSISKEYQVIYLTCSNMRA